MIKNYINNNNNRFLGNRNPTNVWARNRFIPPNVQTPMSISSGGNAKMIQATPQNRSKFYNNETDQIVNLNQNGPEIVEMQETGEQPGNFCIEPRDQIN